MEHVTCKLPTFLGIGVQKGATTWLARMVEQHPEVSIPQKKEVHYFNMVKNYEKGVDWYLDHFEITSETKAVGEFTPNYFWTTPYDEQDREGIMLQNEVVPELVSQLLPDIQLIVCLRDPVERAVSSYFHQIRAGNIYPNERILDVAHFHGIESMGFYDVHLQNWLKFYPLEKFLFLFYRTDIREDKNKKRTLARVFRHIGVDESFAVEDVVQKYNSKHTDFDMRVNHVPLPTFLKRRIKRYTPAVIKDTNWFRLKVTARERKVLRERYAVHNKNLEKMLGRPLPWT